MKSFIAIALLLVLAIAQTPEDCVKEKCKNEYNSCVKEVFGCAAVGYKCKSKCGDDDDACYNKCAYDSGNQKFIDLYSFQIIFFSYECGKLNCPKTAECDLIGCTDKFNS